MSGRRRLYITLTVVLVIAVVIALRSLYSQDKVLELVDGGSVYPR